MDRANVQNNCYPKHMLRVQLSEQDFDSSFKPRRFDIRTPPTDQHLSTAECLALVLSRIEHDEHRIIYDTIMKPLDLMVRQWHSFSHRKPADPPKKKRQSLNDEGADDDERDKRTRGLGLVGNGK
jgi:hypothetical protein